MRNHLLGAMLTATLLLAACGNDSEPANPTTAAPTPDVASAESVLGEILVDANGVTLYGFTNDVDGVSACYEACADAWPPVLVDDGVELGSGLDAAVFSTVERTDGSQQLVAGDWPLYWFAGDAGAGELNGQGSGDVWFVVDTQGSLVKDPVEGDEAAAAVEIGNGETEFGTVLVDENGASLYGFTNDVGGLPSCSGACADAWPPVLVDGADLAPGLDSAVFSVVDRGDGTFQLRAGDWPLYRFAGDGEPGDVNGQGSGDVWFLAAPDGSLIRGDEVSAPTSDGYDY